MALGRILSQSLSRNQHSVVPATRSPASLSKNMNRLLSAAVVSPRFRSALLADPVGALAAGYNGENFHLTPAEYAAVTSLRASTVQEFAVQLLRILQSANGDAAHHATEAQDDLHFAEVAI